LHTVQPLPATVAVPVHSSDRHAARERRSVPNGQSEYRLGPNPSHFFACASETIGGDAVARRFTKR